ncbi:MAG: BolA family protein [Planktomarina sp.]
MSNMAEKIEEKLKDAFTVKHITVSDVSAAHQGHAGYQEGGESHFDVVLQADEFQGMSRIARHRAVHAALGQDIIQSIHALALDLS